MNEPVLGELAEPIVESGIALVRRRILLVLLVHEGSFLGSEAILTIVKEK
jgi:hypothetical protein